MKTPECDYCTTTATGIDEYDEYTCGVESTCTIKVRALPAVIEASDEEDDEEAIDGR